MSIGEKLRTAAAATDRVQDHVAEALETLNGNFKGRIVNGFGVYSDPDQQLSAMRSARDKLDAALRIHGTTKWPSTADYDAAK